jgi:hypothetical protein
LSISLKNQWGGKHPTDNQFIILSFSQFTINQLLSATKCSVLTSEASNSSRSVTKQSVVSATGTINHLQKYLYIAHRSLLNNPFNWLSNYLWIEIYTIMLWRQGLWSGGR